MALNDLIARLSMAMFLSHAERRQVDTAARTLVEAGELPLEMERGLWLLWAEKGF